MPVTGSCWAFASTGAIEAAVAIANQVAQPPYLSAEELADCVSAGCKGGNEYPALMYALGTTHGLACEAAYPYTAGDSGVHSNCQVISGLTKSKHHSSASTAFNHCCIAILQHCCNAFHLWFSRKSRCKMCCLNKNPLSRHDIWLEAMLTIHAFEVDSLLAPQKHPSVTIKG